MKKKIAWNELMKTLWYVCSFNPLIPGGNKRLYLLKQVCLSTYDLLLPPGIIGLRNGTLFWSQQ